MAVAFRSSSTAVATTTITKPAGVADGDILLLCMIGYDNSTGTFTPPSGFTSTPAGLISIDNGIHDTCMQVFWKVASGEGASYTATFSAGSPDLMMAAYTGGDTAAPIGIDSGTQHVASTSTYTATWTPVTSPRGNSMAVAFFGGYEIDGATPAGYTSRINALDTVNDTSDKTVTIGENVNPTCSVAADALSRNTAGLILVIVQSPASALPPGIGNEPLARTSLARASALALSGGAPLMPMAAAVIVQPRHEAERFVARRVYIDPGAAGSALPSQAPTASPTMTWFSHSPLRVGTSVGTDAGAAAISPLNPPHGSWYPSMPDMGVAPRRERDAPGSGLVRPLTVSAVISLQPGADWVPRNRPQVENGSGFGERPLYLGNLSWTGPDSARPALRRLALHEAAGFVPAMQLTPTDLSWAAQPSSPVRRLSVRPDVAVADLATLLPLFQPQAPSWLSPPADVVRREAKPQDYGSGPVILALVQARDLSWMAESPRATPRPLPRHEPSFTPQATVVTLSSWGWIPEVPSRPGLRTISNAFVSALVPPAIASTAPWGWIPEGPDRGFRRAPNTHQDQPPIGVLAMQALGWLPESPIPLRPRRAADASIASFPGASPGSVWGWLHDQGHPARRRTALEDPAQVPPAPQVVAWGWFVEGPQPRSPAPRAREDAQAPIRPMAGLTAYWQHWQVGPRAPRPVVSGFNETPLLVLVPASLPPMPPGEAPFIVARSAAALRAALEAGHGMIVVPAGAISVGALSAIMQEVGAWRAVLTE